MARNGDKEEHLGCMMGKGSVRKMKQLRGGVGLQGRVVDAAKYLGNIVTMDGRTKANVDRRIQAARGGYYLIQDPNMRIKTRRL